MYIRLVVALILGGVSLRAQSYNAEKEAALGAQLAADTRRSTTPIDSPAVQAYLDRLGQRLAAQVPDAAFPFTFRAIAEDRCPLTHEPVALLGAYIFVSAPLFAATQNEAEFAGMLAQAMERIARRYGLRRNTRDQLSDSAPAPLIYMSSACSERPRVDKGALLEIDRLAVQVMSRAGFDPLELARYLGRVQTDTTAYNSLPDRDLRTSAIHSVIERLPPSTYVTNDDEFKSIQQEVRRLAEERQKAAPAVPSLMRAASKPLP